MFALYQIVNVLIDPVFVVLASLALGLLSLRKGRRRCAGVLIYGGLTYLFLISWNPFVDGVCWWMERDYPMRRAEDYQKADAVLVLGGGAGRPSAEASYPYPTLTEAADRVWFGALLWHAQSKQNPSIKIYCSGPDVTQHTPEILMSLGVPQAAIIPVEGPLNTEEEARGYAQQLDGKHVLLVTSAVHMKRAARIFAKYAPSLRVVPAPTDHRYFHEDGRFAKWTYYVPNLGALSLATALQHELIGLLRYSL